MRFHYSVLSDRYLLRDIFSRRHFQHLLRDRQALTAAVRPVVDLLAISKFLPKKFRVAVPK
jgi:hypothetical protein